MNFQIPTKTIDGLEIPDNGLARLVAHEVMSGQSYPQIANFSNVQMIVDVGANVGLSAIYFHTLYPEALIHCFEPHPACIELLEHNTRTIMSIISHECALGRYDGVGFLHEGQQDSVQNSFLKSAGCKDAKIEVQCKDARNALPPLLPIDILKIDTEGCEDVILESIAPMLHKIRAVYLETHSPELLDQCFGLLSATHFLYYGQKHDMLRGEWIFLAHDDFDELQEKARPQQKNPTGTTSGE